MSQSIEYEFPDGRLVVVEYDYRPHHRWVNSPAEAEIISVADGQGREIKLDPDEDRRIIEFILDQEDGP